MLVYQFLISTQYLVPFNFYILLRGLQRMYVHLLKIKYYFICFYLDKQCKPI